MIFSLVIVHDIRSSLSCTLMTVSLCISGYDNNSSNPVLFALYAASPVQFLDRYGDEDLPPIREESLELPTPECDQAMSAEVIMLCCGMLSCNVSMKL